MLYTKKQFADYLGVKPPKISDLLKRKKIVANKNGQIDSENPVNIRYLEIERAGNKQKFNASKGSYDGADTEVILQDKKNKDELEIKHLEEKIKKEIKTNEVLDIKLALEKKELFETEVLNHLIISSFDFFFKNVLEYPHNIVDEVVDIVKISETPRNDIIKLLTNGLKEQIEKGLSESEKAMHRFYDEK